VRAALDRDVAPVLLGDAVDRREGELAAPDPGLGGEERLEDVAPRGLVHAGAGVADSEPYMGARTGPRMGLDERLVQVDVRRLEDEAPAPGHRGAGILDEVENDTLELPGIHAGRPERLLQAQGQLDTLAGDGRERQPRHELVEVDQPGLQRLLAGERQ